ncbi:unnamed protein product [Malus baccata var. baccata]
MSNRKEANFGFQEFAVRFQFIPNKKGSTNSVTEISNTFELSEQRHVRKSKNFIGLFYKHHTHLKVQRLKYKIKYSKSNWGKSIAMGKLSKLKINHENLKHQVQANGWQRTQYFFFDKRKDNMGKNYMQ